MKGFMIYETPLWGNEENTVYLQEVKDASYALKQIGSDDITCCLEGIATKDPVTKATCNKDDTYDFETGALIALMKMCGRDKVIKACDELYKDDNYKNALQEMTENNEKLIEENNYLNYVISCRESAIESLENTRDLLINKNNELIEENRKLKLDCEKLQHGYIDTDMIFCGGRQNGKQYTALVNMFKKLDQKKVDAAYKEAYDTKLPVWQKEVLKQMYGIYQKSKEKIELQGFHIEIKPPTKRQEMWNDILACGDCEHSKYIDVKKEDLEVFAKECNEKKIFSISGYEFHIKEFWFDDDRCIFQIFRKPAGFICAKSVGFAYEDTIVDYLPPMRWDLFKKGRLAVKVNYYNYKEFYEACEKELGKKPSTYFWDNVTISICKKDGNFEIFTIEHQKTTGRKIVNWEDVR